MNILDIGKLFRHKQTMVIQHKDICLCPSCTGMDVVHAEMRVARGLPRYRSRTTVTTVEPYHHLLSKEQLERVQTTNEKVIKKSNKYFKALFGVK
jgi:hypothetical protein